MNNLIKRLVELELRERGILDSIGSDCSKDEKVIEIKQNNVKLSNIDAKDGTENKEVKKLTKDEYNQLIKDGEYENKPLPKEYYARPSEGVFFAQFHFSGILPSVYEKYKEGKIPLWQTFANSKVHINHRSKFDNREQLLQFIINEDSIGSYLRVMKGEQNSDTNNIARGLVMVKSSTESDQSLKNDETTSIGMILNSDDIEEISKYIIEKNSYWIPPNQIGSDTNTYSYMANIVTGKVQSGIMRDSYKELFTQPDDDIPKHNQELFNGRWIFKALNIPPKLWFVWKAVTTPTAGDPYCMDIETEILTDHGWKYYIDITDEDLFASLNIENRNLEWVEKKQLICYPYHGKLIRFHNRQTDIMVIPEHKMLIEHGTTNKKLKFVEAQKLKSSYHNYIYKGVNWVSPPQTIKVDEKTFDEELFCKFMGWYLSEGSVTKHANYKGYCIKISQQNEENRDIIGNVIEKLGFRFYETKTSLCLDHETLLAEWLLQFGKSYEKYIPSEIKSASRKGISEFLLAYLRGDGTERITNKYSKNLNHTFTNSHERVFYTSSKGMADDLGELILKVGGVPSYYVSKTKGKIVQFPTGKYTINHDMIYIRWNKYTRSELCNINIDEVDYNGDVWSVELVKNHTLMIRRHGKVCWTGNCGCDQGNFDLIPADELTKWNKEDYPEFEERTEGYK